METASDTSKPISKPQLQCLLGEITFNATDTAPLGGINPYSEHFDKIGQQFLRFLIDHGKLRPQSAILEIGCGTGRLAKQLINYLDGGKYCGFDVQPQWIEYCKASYNRKNFDFKTIDIYHDEYNPKGTIDPNTVVLPYKDRSFDTICAIAVFNHFRTSWTTRYLEEIARILRPNGTLLCTAIILNNSSMRAIELRKMHPFKFDMRSIDGWYDYSERQLFNTAIPETILRRTLLQNKLMVNEPIRYGEWCGSPTAITGHDVIIANKR